jgi:site-specific DNA recombinase
MYKRKLTTKRIAKRNRYILYARKSTSSEDRQVASIESQVEVMQESAREHGLKVVKVMSESASGFKIGRPVFNQMVQMIERGEAEGIVVWKLSRLSRNPDDAGTIMGFLERKQIKHIRTIERNWMPEDNVMMMYVEFGMNNQFSKDLSLDTRRGLIKKAERGWLPNAVLPPGYKHVQYKRLGEDEIIIDEQSFPLIQKGLKLVASRQMTPVQARQHLIALGLKGKKGGPLPNSTWYEILVNPLYAGTFEYPLGSDQIYPSQAEKAIEPHEFNTIQEILGYKRKSKPQKHFLPYTGMMACGECGCSITAEKQLKKQKNGNTHNYTYYRCTKKNKDKKCAQSYLRVEKLESQYLDLLDSIEVPESFHKWALSEIKLDQEKLIQDRGLSIKRARASYDETVSTIDKLIEKYMDDKIPEEYYQNKLAELEKTKDIRKSVFDGIDQRVNERLTELDQDLSFAVSARQSFLEGNDHKKRELVAYLGSNLLLTNGILDIELKKPLKQIQKIAISVNAEAKRFEPLDNADNSAQFVDYLSTNPAMGG